MSIEDYAYELESEARAALLAAGALVVCRRHEDVTIRVGNPDAERHAYALATNSLKRDGAIELKREDLMEAIKDELEMAADDGCPVCQRDMDD